MKVDVKSIKNYLLTGVSYMQPLTVIGGILLALALATGTSVEGQGMVVTNQFMKNVLSIGGAGFAMMIPVLCAYIAYAIAGKPAIAPGMVAGYIANNPIGADEVKTGFLGAMLLGFVVGYVVNVFKKIKWPSFIKPIAPILIIPVITALVVCLGYIYILANPLGFVVAGLNGFLADLSTGSLLILGVVMGALVAFDMGGPVNKTVCLFAIGMMSEGRYEFFGICAVAICTPPLALGLATLLFKNKFTPEEKDSGMASLFMGMIGISEGAIPFAATDPIRVIPANMIGGAVGGAIAAIAGVKDYAPHGGPIVLPVIDEKMWYVIAILIGTLITAFAVGLLKKTINNKGESVA